MHAIRTCSAPGCENDLDSEASVGTGYCDTHLQGALSHEHGDAWDDTSLLALTVRAAWFAYRAERDRRAAAVLTPGQQASRDRMHAIPTTTYCGQCGAATNALGCCPMSAEHGAAA